MRGYIKSSSQAEIFQNREQNIEHVELSIAALQVCSTAACGPGYSQNMKPYLLWGVPLLGKCFTRKSLGGRVVMLHLYTPSLQYVMHLTSGG